MSPLSSEQLKEQIAIIPSELRKALEQQAKTRMIFAHLQAQIDKLEAEIEQENDEEENDDFDDEENSDLDDNLELLKMESAVERIKLKLTEAEDRAEIDFRRTTEKTTEALVKAAVGTTPAVIELRTKLLDAKESVKERRITLQNERMKAHEAKLEARYAMPVKEVLPENDKVLELREKLSAAEYNLLLADIEVEVARAKIETYKMLVNLENRA